MCAASVVSGRLNASLRNSFPVIGYSNPGNAKTSCSHVSPPRNGGIHRPLESVVQRPVLDDRDVVRAGNPVQAHTTSISWRPRLSIDAHVVDQHRRWKDAVRLRIAVEVSPDRVIEDQEERLIKDPVAVLRHTGARDDVVLG